MVVTWGTVWRRVTWTGPVMQSISEERRITNNYFCLMLNKDSLIACFPCGFLRQVCMGLGTVSSQHFYGSPIELTWGGGGMTAWSFHSHWLPSPNRVRLGPCQLLIEPRWSLSDLWNPGPLAPPIWGPRKSLLVKSQIITITTTTPHGIELFPRHTLEHAELAAEVVTCTVCMQGLSLFSALLSNGPAIPVPRNNKWIGLSLSKLLLYVFHELQETEQSHTLNLTYIYRLTAKFYYDRNCLRAMHGQCCWTMHGWCSAVLIILTCALGAGLHTGLLSSEPNFCSGCLHRQERLGPCVLLACCQLAPVVQVGVTQLGWASFELQYIRVCFRIRHRYLFGLSFSYGLLGAKFLWGFLHPRAVQGNEIVTIYLWSICTPCMWFESEVMLFCILQC